MNAKSERERVEQGDNGVHVIFVGDIQEKWRQILVTAGQIMTEAGVSDPGKFVLEALVSCPINI
jgi:hypothetical protein